jgi:4-oxalocrotonate tautomerase family enzyme
MPTLQVSLIRGYAGAVKQRLCRRLTAATVGALGASPDAVTVFLHEVDADGYARGGQARTPAAAPVDTADHLDHAVVTCHGHLHGEWPDGTAFEGVRFIDRFEIRAGRLTRQDVWNDLALVAR